MFVFISFVFKKRKQIKKTRLLKEEFILSCGIWSKKVSKLIYKPMCKINY